MIKPTVARMVLYFPSILEKANDRPMAATVAYVHSDRLVNLGVLDYEGNQFRAVHVPLLQDDDAAPNTGAWCEWMVYQKQVASGAIPPTLHAEPKA